MLEDEDNVRRCQMWEDVRRYQMWREDVRCEKMSDVRRCEKMNMSYLLRALEEEKKGLEAFQALGREAGLEETLKVPVSQ